jgi:hypothetical protein
LKFSNFSLGEPSNITETPKSQPSPENVKKKETTLKRISSQKFGDLVLSSDSYKEVTTENNKLEDKYGGKKFEISDTSSESEVDDLTLLSDILSTQKTPTTNTTRSSNYTSSNSSITSSNPSMDSSPKPESSRNNRNKNNTTATFINVNADDEDEFAQMIRDLDDIPSKFCLFFRY